MTCNCPHCIEIKKQLDRAAQRHDILLKARPSKLAIW